MLVFFVVDTYDNWRAHRHRFHSPCGSHRPISEENGVSDLAAGGDGEKKEFG